MTPYALGVAAEKRTAELLRRDGYWVMESRGSHGVADLVALKRGQVLLIQVKRGEAKLDGSWFNELHQAAHKVGALPVIADWPVPPGRVRGQLRLRRITGQHHPRSKSWPCQPFTTDQLAEAQARAEARWSAIEGADD